MTRYYKRPVLLIEFDPNKSFALQVGAGYIGTGEMERKAQHLFTYIHT